MPSTAIQYELVSSELPKKLCLPNTTSNLWLCGRYMKPSADVSAKKHLPNSSSKHPTSSKNLFVTANNSSVKSNNIIEPTGSHNSFVSTNAAIGKTAHAAPYTGAHAAPHTGAHAAPYTGATNPKTNHVASANTPVPPARKQYQTAATSHTDKRREEEGKKAATFLSLKRSSPHTQRDSPQKTMGLSSDCSPVAYTSSQRLKQFEATSTPLLASTSSGVRGASSSPSLMSIISAANPSPPVAHTTTTFGNPSLGVSSVVQGSPIVSIQMLKTKICVDFKNSKCVRGEFCPYAHSELEVRPLPDFKKTKMCTLHMAGKCESAADCIFAHTKEELRFTCSFPQYKTELCRFHSNHGGRGCNYGDMCPYAHSNEEKESAVASAGRAMQGVDLPGVTGDGSGGGVFSSSLDNGEVSSSPIGGGSSTAFSGGIAAFHSENKANNDGGNSGISPTREGVSKEGGNDGASAGNGSYTLCPPGEISSALSPQSPVKGGRRGSLNSIITSNKGGGARQEPHRRPPLLIESPNGRSRVCEVDRVAVGSPSQERVFSFQRNDVGKLQGGVSPPIYNPSDAILNETPSVQRMGGPFEGASPSCPSHTLEQSLGVKAHPRTHQIGNLCTKIAPDVALDSRSVQGALSQLSQQKRSSFMGRRYTTGIGDEASNDQLPHRVAPPPPLPHQFTKNRHQKRWQTASHGRNSPENSNFRNNPSESAENLTFSSSAAANVTKDVEHGRYNSRNKEKRGVKTHGNPIANALSFGRPVLGNDVYFNTHEEMLKDPSNERVNTQKIHSIKKTTVNKPTNLSLTGNASSSEAACAPSSGKFIDFASLYAKYGVSKKRQGSSGSAQCGDSFAGAVIKNMATTPPTMATPLVTAKTRTFITPTSTSACSTPASEEMPPSSHDGEIVEDCNLKTKSSVSTISSEKEEIIMTTHHTSRAPLIEERVSSEHSTEEFPNPPLDQRQKLDFLWNPSSLCSNVVLNSISTSCGHKFTHNELADTEDGSGDGLLISTNTLPLSASRNFEDGGIEAADAMITQREDGEILKGNTSSSFLVNSDFKLERSSAGEENFFFEDFFNEDVSRPNGYSNSEFITLDDFCMMTNMTEMTDVQLHANASTLLSLAPEISISEGEGDREMKMYADAVCEGARGDSPFHGSLYSLNDAGDVFLHSSSNSSSVSYIEGKNLEGKACDNLGKGVSPSADDFLYNLDCFRGSNAGGEICVRKSESAIPKVSTPITVATNRSTTITPFSMMSDLQLLQQAQGFTPNNSASLPSSSNLPEEFSVFPTKETPPPPPPPPIIPFSFPDAASVPVPESPTLLAHTQDSEDAGKISLEGGVGMASSCDVVDAGIDSGMNSSFAADTEAVTLGESMCAALETVSETNVGLSVEGFEEELEVMALASDLRNALLSGEPISVLQVVNTLITKQNHLVNSIAGGSHKIAHASNLQCANRGDSGFAYNLGYGEAANDSAGSTGIAIAGDSIGNPSSLFSTTKLGEDGKGDDLIGSSVRSISARKTSVSSPSSSASSSSFSASSSSFSASSPSFSASSSSFSASSSSFSASSLSFSASSSSFSASSLSSSASSSSFSASSPSSSASSPSSSASSPSSSASSPSFSASSPSFSASSLSSSASSSSFSASSPSSSASSPSSSASSPSSSASSSSSSASSPSFSASSPSFSASSPSFSASSSSFSASSSSFSPSSSSRADSRNGILGVPSSVGQPTSIGPPPGFELYISP